MFNPIRKFRLGLRQRVAFAILVSYVLFAIIFIYPTVLAGHRLVEEALIGSSVELARHLAWMIEGSLQKKDLSLLRRIARQVTRIKNVSYVIVQDSGNRVLVSTRGDDDEGSVLSDQFSVKANAAPGELVQEISPHPKGLFHQLGHFFDFTVPVMLEGKKAGLVRLGITTRRANEEMYSITFYALLITALAMGFSITLALLVDRRIRMTLGKLISVTGEMAGGDLSKRVDIKTGDELQELGQSFNKMADRLERYYAELESKVQERTKELEDITQMLKEAQTQQLQYERVAVLGEIAASVSHEVRTPLNSMNINLQRLKRKLAAEPSLDSSVYRETINMISCEINRIDAVLNEFMKFIRIPQPDFQCKDLNSVIPGVLQLLDVEASRHRIRLEFRPEDHIPNIRIDEDKIKQILLNLILNSIQAMPRGGIIRVHTGLRDDRYIFLKVSDTGSGIAPEHLDKIFQPFFTTKEKGTGLGLAIVSRIVNEHGGKITCQSDPQKGTSFEILLPIN